MATQLQDPGVDIEADTHAEATGQLDAVEQLAVEMGWSPDATKLKDPGKWKPAKDWIKTGDTITKGLKDDVKRLRDQVDRIASAGAKSAERMLKQQADELNAKFEERVKAGDTAGAAKVADEFNELKATAKASTGERDYEAEFAERNPWYGKDDDASAYAVTIARREAAKNKSPEDQLVEAEKAVRKRFPELFDDAGAEGKRETLTTKPQPGVHAPGTRTIEAPKAQTFATLPADAKRAAETYFAKFESFAKQNNTKFDRAKAERDYAAEYFAE